MAAVGDEAGIVRLLLAAGADPDRACGPGAETVARHVEEDGGTTVVVEVLRDGVPAAGDEQQTGHGAIATILEERLGVRAPCASRAERALKHGSPDRDEWIEAP